MPATNPTCPVHPHRSSYIDSAFGLCIQCEFQKQGKSVAEARDAVWGAFGRFYGGALDASDPQAALDALVATVRARG